MIACTECGVEIPEGTYYAAEPLYVAPRRDAGRLVEIVKRLLDSHPDWHDQEIGERAVWEWLDTDPEDLVAAVRHYERECGDNQDRRLAEEKEDDR